MVREDTRQVRKDIHSLVGAIHTHCQICVQTDRILRGNFFIRPMVHVHHLWGRNSKVPGDIRESIIGVLPVCLYHHNEYPPLLSTYEYYRREKHWNLLFDSWWRVLISYTKHDIGESYHNFIRKELIALSNDEVTKLFLSGRTIQ